MYVFEKKYGCCTLCWWYDSSRKNKEDIDELYTSLLEGNENFKLTKEGMIDKYLGVELVDNGQGSFEAR